MIQQPISRNCFVCGVENEAGLHMHFFETETELVQVTAEYTVSSRYQGYPGIVHGGIIAAMLDEVITRTIFRGDPPRLVVTAKLAVRYRRPVPVETPLKLTGHIVEDKGKVITVAGDIYGPDGTLLAQGEATVVEVDPAFFGDAMNVQRDWRVDPNTNADRGGGA